LNITYLIKNKSDYTLMNLSLATKESGPLSLNVSGILPGQTAEAIESLRIEDGGLQNYLLRTAEANAFDPNGIVFKANSNISIKIGGGSE